MLVAKRFIIPFESGIVVIKHWKIHNYIRGDRKKATAYPEEMALLTEKENGAYSLLTDKCQSSDSQLTDKCPHRLGKGRLGQDSLGEDRVVEVSVMPDSNGTPPQIQCLGGTLGKGVVFLTEEQESALLDKLGLEGFDRYVEKLADFIINKNANVANHYQTILKWYEEDTKV
jgi:hypothetical protein